MNFDLVRPPSNISKPTIVIAIPHGLNILVCVLYINGVFVVGPLFLSGPFFANEGSDRPTYARLKIHAVSA